MKSLKFAIIPLNILGFQLQFFSRSYEVRCLGFFIQGICYLKMNCCFIFLKDICEQKYETIVSTVTIGRDHSVIAMFCFVMVAITRDAVTYLHFVNGINIFFYVIICLISVESPLYLLSKDRTQEAINNLNYIARVNSLLSENKPYIFNSRIKIFGST
jgi:hypothetical protein